MKSRIVALSIPALVLASPAFAAVKGELAAIDKRLTACVDRNQSNADMGQCSADARKAADKVLNRVYKSFADRLKSKPADGLEEDDKEILKRLVASERAWIAYRDAECSLRGTQMLNGSGEGLVIGQCLYKMTSERAQALDDIMNGN